MSLHSRQSLYEKMKNKKFREAFVESRISQTLALQARVLRQEAEMSQEDLAKHLGTSQNAISRLESPKYGRPSISTLRRYASFFDVGLIVRFVPFSRLMDWTREPDEQSILVPPFAADSGFIEEEIQSKEASRTALAAMPGKAREIAAPVESDAAMGLSDPLVNKAPALNETLASQAGGTAQFFIGAGPVDRKQSQSAGHVLASGSGGKLAFVEHHAS